MTILTSNPHVKSMIFMLEQKGLREEEIIKEVETYLKRGCAVCGADKVNYKEMMGEDCCRRAK